MHGRTMDVHWIKRLVNPNRSYRRSLTSDGGSILQGRVYTVNTAINEFILQDHDYAHVHRGVRDEVELQHRLIELIPRREPDPSSGGREPDPSSGGDNCMYFAVYLITPTFAIAPLPLYGIIYEARVKTEIPVIQHHLLHACNEAVWLMEFIPPRLIELRPKQRSQHDDCTTNTITPPSILTKLFTEWLDRDIDVKSYIDLVDRCSLRLALSRDGVIRSTEEASQLIRHRFLENTRIMMQNTVLLSSESFSRFSTMTTIAMRLPDLFYPLVHRDKYETAAWVLKDRCLDMVTYGRACSTAEIILSEIQERSLSGSGGGSTTMVAADVRCGINLDECFASWFSTMLGMSANFFFLFGLTYDHYYCMPEIRLPCLHDWLARRLRANEWEKGKKFRFLRNISRQQIVLTHDEFTGQLRRDLLDFQALERHLLTVANQRTVFLRLSVPSALDSPVTFVYTLQLVQESRARYVYVTRAMVGVVSSDDIAQCLHKHHAIMHKNVFIATAPVSPFDLLPSFDHIKRPIDILYLLN